MRLYWTYNHHVARYQEVSLMMELGIEVIVSYDRLPQAQADPNYHNEADPLYPAWRQTLDLPTSTVEQIRRINLYACHGLPDPAARTLLNKHIDAIYLSGSPETLRGLGTWYQGVILFRLMGYYISDAEQGAYLQAVEKIAADPAFKSKLVFMPGYRFFIPQASPRLADHPLVVNAWVEKDRLPERWAAENSQPRAALAISYINLLPYFRQQYETATQNIQSLPLLIVGKNDKKASPARDDTRILGQMDFPDLYRTVADSRVFIDAGTCRTHLIWPPLEACAMGVPILFCRDSGLTDPCREAGYTEEELRQIGMFDNFAELDKFLQENAHKFDVLRALAERQYSILLQDVFSRARAKSQFAAYLKDHRNDPRFKIHRKKRAAQETLPPDSVQGTAYVPASAITGVAGHLRTGPEGKISRLCRPLLDRRGQMVIAYLPKLEDGRSRLEIDLTTRALFGRTTAIIEVGVWETDDTFKTERHAVQTIDPGAPDLHFLIDNTGPAYGKTRELRILWTGWGRAELRGYTVRPIGSLASETV
jgi:hypothetical protein